jgi:hypothetical protein
LRARLTAPGLAGAFVLVAGAFGVVSVGERRVAERAAINERLAEQLAANELIVRSRGALLAERRRLRTDLGRARIAGGTTPPTAQFLRDVTDTVRSKNVAVTAIAVPNAAGPHLLASGPNGADELTITLEGRYDDVLTAIRRLSLLRVPARVEVGSIVRATRPGAPAVSALLHITLQNTESLAAADVQRRP